MTAARVLEMTAEAQLPGSVEAERSVLGAILLDNAMYIEAAQTLTAGDFLLDSHRRIYRRMAEMSAALTEIDAVTVGEQLTRHRELEAVGGMAYLCSLTDGLPRRTSIEHHTRIVKEKARLRQIISVANAAIARAMDGERSTEITGGLLETVLDVESKSQAGKAIKPREFMPEVLRELEIEAQSGKLVGLPTGVETLDQATSGSRRGELVVIGARPGSGKTALACQMVAANAEAGNHVGVFSLEMSRWDLGRRFLSGNTSVSASKIRHPSHISKDEWIQLATGAAEICEWPVWFDDSGSISLSELLARAQMLIRRMKVRLIIVDYLHLVQTEAREIRERIGKVADALRQLAKSERIAVVLLSSLRKLENVNDEPTMLDLKESSDIESHAHVVLLLHVPTGPDGRPTGEEKIIIGKNRNGVKGPIPVIFSEHKLRFYPRAEQREYQPAGVENEKD